mmetsp:Transcript_111735/g.316343  ORF Transcript_111735/g.316343 Transcript_111735/m.316343 type:complete len:324 (+) Transcript_111735:640-1611(+)
MWSAVSPCIHRFGLARAARSVRAAPAFPYTTLACSGRRPGWPLTRAPCAQSNDTTGSSAPGQRSVACESRRVEARTRSPPRHASTVGRSPQRRALLASSRAMRGRYAAGARPRSWKPISSSCWRSSARPSAPSPPALGRLCTGSPVRRDASSPRSSSWCCSRAGHWMASVTLARHSAQVFCCRSQPRPHCAHVTCPQGTWTMGQVQGLMQIGHVPSEASTSAAPRVLPRAPACGVGGARFDVKRRMACVGASLLVSARAGDAFETLAAAPARDAGRTPPCSARPCASSSLSAAPPHRVVPNDPCEPPFDPSTFSATSPSHSTN